MRAGGCICHMASHTLPQPNVGARERKRKRERGRGGKGKKKEDKYLDIGLR